MQVIEDMDAIRQFPSNEDGDLMNPPLFDRLLMCPETSKKFDKLDVRRFDGDGVADAFENLPVMAQTRVPRVDGRITNSHEELPRVFATATFCPTPHGCGEPPWRLLVRFRLAVSTGRRAPDRWRL
jgi:hypothetical protein